ncbi:phage portal protein [Metabacillus idriensis]|uniref:phage portal protein n=1 Tax=Metabacillus idriensis TaxID=324768 RepID=UPI0020417902|nr:phage portal protein [Metabacillus idriensis]MCM3598699.1 phage portal protein [Metabacillus idriensis]
MFDFTYELEQLNEGDRTPQLIQRIIEKHKPRADEMKLLYERYRVKEEGLPILNRTLDDPMEVNNQVNNDFFSEIIDTKVGFFAGTPVTYKAEGSAGKTIQEFQNRNRLADVDAETTKYAAICGYASRLQYIDKMGLTRIVNVKPWQAVLIGENGIDETDYAIRYYTVKTEKEEEYRVEFYEGGEENGQAKLTEFRGSDLSKLAEFSSMDLVYNFCPMWGYENNEEMLGDAEKVLRLIDAYDRTISDVNSEIEAFRMAYMAFFGVEAPDDEEEEKFMKNGTFYFRGAGSTGEKQNAMFITKDLNDSAIENHLKRIHENIYRFSKTPDMGEDAFGGTVSGIAAKYRMLGLENKTATFERKFKSASIRMFEILGSALSKKGSAIDPYAVEMTFTRNFPQDLMNEADIQTKLKGNVSDETRLGALSIVTDVQEELAKMEAEEAAYLEKVDRLELNSQDGEKDELGGSRSGKAGTD